MKRLSKLRPSPATGIAVLALFVALGGSSYAALSLTGTDIRDGTLRGKDVRNRSLTGRDLKGASVGGTAVKESSLGSVPTAAASNLTGGLALSAVVPSDGTPLVRGRGVLSAAHAPGTGNYQVIFSRDVRGCVYSATVGDPSAGVPPNGYASVSSLASNVNGVRVRTFQGNNPENRPFHLTVSC